MTYGQSWPSPGMYWGPKREDVRPKPKQYGFSEAPEDEVIDPKIIEAEARRREEERKERGGRSPVSMRWTPDGGFGRVFRPHPPEPPRQREASRKERRRRGGRVRRDDVPRTSTVAASDRHCQRLPVPLVWLACRAEPLLGSVPVRPAVALRHAASPSTATGETVVIEEQRPAQPTGQLGTHVDGLRSFGQEITGHSDTIKNMGFGGVFGNIAMPGGAVARALAAAGEACESAVARVHEDYVFGGDASVNDARMFQERDEDNAASIRSAVDQGEGV